jgi:hypothetical protein
MDRVSPSAAQPEPNHGLDPEDYYYDGPYLVFTAAYHLKRGSCCGSHCRHCPYGLAPGGVAPGDAAPDAGAPTAG